MFLRDPHIEKSVGKQSSEFFQPGAFRHGGGDSHKLLFFSAQVFHGIGKYFRIRESLLIGKRFPRFYIKRSCSVKTVRMQAGRSVATAFFRKDMNDHRSLHSLGFIKELHHLAHIVAVHWSQICQPHIFKKHSRNDQLLDAALGLPHRIHQGGSHFRDFFQCLRHAEFHSCVGFRRSQGAEIGRHSSHVPGYGHIVVVKDNDKIGLQFRRVIQRFISHTACKRPVSDHGNHIIVVA